MLTVTSGSRVAHLVPSVGYLETEVTSESSLGEFTPPVTFWSRVAHLVPGASALRAVWRLVAAAAVLDSG